MNRKYVFSEEQFRLLIASPPLATALVQAIKNDPELTVKEAIKIGQASLRQFDMFKAAVADGSIVDVKTLEDAEKNFNVLKTISDANPLRQKAKKEGVSV